MNTIKHFEIPAKDVNMLKSFYDKLFDWKILRITAGEMDYYTIQTSPKNEKGNPLSGINGGMYQKVDENCIPVNCACTEKPDSWG
jgi:predicted enzyme related to lactoylglutathione lyase